MATIFSVVFTTTNILLASMVCRNDKQNYFCTVVIFISTITTLIVQDFDFKDVTQHTVQALVLSCTFACLLSPAMVYFSQSIVRETMKEARLSYIERDSYRQLFDALQEGIIVVQDDQITFMN